MTSRWCHDCGHETHDPGQCTYKMPWSRVMQQVARGRRPMMTQQPRCDCDEPQRRER